VPAVAAKPLAEPAGAEPETVAGRGLASRLQRLGTAPAELLQPAELQDAPLARQRLGGGRRARHFGEADGIGWQWGAAGHG
jgi:hypothetical protein